MNAERNPKALCTKILEKHLGAIKKARTPFEAYVLSLIANGIAIAVCEIDDGESLNNLHDKISEVVANACSYEPKTRSYLSPLQFVSLVDQFTPKQFIEIMMDYFPVAELEIAINDMKSSADSSNN
jgi:hypothetical protein